ncbi:MAG: GNAT family N-acetyltransferase [Rhodothermia bacterium]|nr:GNAT family N-acetyltransferase [Rhodothermia bacterium]
MPESSPIITVRHASTKDAAAVHACLAAAFKPYRHLYTPDAISDTVPTVQSLRKRFRVMRVLVAVDGAGAVVGTVGYQVLNSGDGHLRGMAVVPNLQGRGIARQLLDQAEYNLRQQGCSRVTLDTTEPLRRATHFYRRHGYSPTGVVGDFFGMALFEYAKTLHRGP